MYTTYNKTIESNKKSSTQSNNILFGFQIIQHNLHYENQRYTSFAIQVIPLCILNGGIEYRNDSFNAMAWVTGQQLSVFYALTNFSISI